jgi:hypothetical protein
LDGPERNVEAAFKRIGAPAPDPAFKHHESVNETVVVGRYAATPSAGILPAAHPAMASIQRQKRPPLRSGRIDRVTLGRRRNNSI